MGTRLTWKPSKARSGADVDYAQLEKLFGEAPESVKGRYSPAECTGIRKHAITDAPERKHVSTTYAERYNLTMRMNMRRFTRLTNAFSKKAENHGHSLALHFVYYNCVRVHKALRMAPAMAAGLTNKLMDMGDLVAMIDAYHEREAKRPKQVEVANCVTACGAGCLIRPLCYG